MRVVFRTDVSQLIGTGHLMRCLTLAHYLHERGAEVHFITRDWPGGGADLPERRGYKAHRLPPVPVSPESKAGIDDYAAWLGVSQAEDAEQTGDILPAVGSVDWLVVDHYGIDSRWEERVGQYANKMMVIDDLANRPHECDLLLDQNFYLDLETRYDRLVPPRCRTLLGPRYAVLRPEFVDARVRLKPRDGDVSRVLVFFGGCDSTGETMKTLDSLKTYQPDGVIFDVLATDANARREAIEQRCSGLPRVRYHRSIDNMAQAMLDADLALGGGGTTTWERCFLGLPTITVEVAENQRQMLEDMASQGAVRHLGRHGDVTAETIAEALRWAFRSPEQVRDLGRTARQLMGPFDPERACRVVDELFAPNGPGC